MVIPRRVWISIPFVTREGILFLYSKNFVKSSFYCTRIEFFHAWRKNHSCTRGKITSNWRSLTFSRFFLSEKLKVEWYQSVSRKNNEMLTLFLSFWSNLQEYCSWPGGWVGIEFLSRVKVKNLTPCDGKIFNLHVG